MPSAIQEGRRSLSRWIGLVSLALLLPALPSGAEDCSAILGEIRAVEAEAVALMGDRAGASRQKAADLKRRLDGAKQRLETCRATPATSKKAERGESGDDVPAEPGRPEAKARLDPAASDKKVLDAYGKDIPKSARTPSAADVTVIQDDELFRRELQRRYPSISDGFAKRVNGYVYENRIFVNAAKANEATPIHEALHHYSHDDFRKAFYRVNGVKINEGVTEYFTRKLTKVDRTGIYDVEIRFAKRIARAVGEGTLRKAYFRGDAGAIEEISDYLKKGASTR